MWGLFITIGAVVGFVVLAHQQAAEPTIKPGLVKIRLAWLARIPERKLTLDQAEDGVVLSRRLGEPDLERRFAAVAMSLRPQRPKK
jgi:hypothetical protein